MIQVSVRNCQSFEQAMRILKSKMKKEHVIEDYKKHMRYEKPSDKSRKEKIELTKRARRMQRLRDQ